jgi:hypothetical protein
VRVQAQPTASSSGRSVVIAPTPRQML